MFVQLVPANMALGFRENDSGIGNPIWFSVNFVPNRIFPGTGFSGKRFRNRKSDLVFSKLCTKSDFSRTNPIWYKVD
jgi:hypothetical protein